MLWCAVVLWWGMGMKTEKCVTTMYEGFRGIGANNCIVGLVTFSFFPIFFHIYIWKKIRLVNKYIHLF